MNWWDSGQPIYWFNNLPVQIIAYYTTHVVIQSVTTGEQLSIQKSQLQEHPLPLEVSGELGGILTELKQFLIQVGDEDPLARQYDTGQILSRMDKLIATLTSYRAPSWESIDGNPIANLALADTLKTKADLVAGVIPSSQLPPIDVDADWGEIGGQIANQTDLVYELNNKANTGHGHTAASVGAIALNEKGAAGGVATLTSAGVLPDSQISADITRDTEFAAGLLTKADYTSLDAHTTNINNPHFTTAIQVGAIALTDKGVPLGVATLNASGVIPSSQIPPLAITDTFPVTTQVAMLALAAEIGDVAVRTDLHKSYILRVSPASTLANWQELETPTDTVLSVNGQVGTVSLTASSVGADPTGTASSLIAIHETTTNHPVATVSAKGMMSETDKVKLNGIASGATANSTDTQLRDRFTHTGTQAISTVTNLQGSLDAKAATTDLTAHTSNTSNPHATTAAQVNAIAVSEKGAAGGVASLDASGLIPSAQLPPLAITDVFPVASQATMLALVAEVGDIAVRTDLHKTYILRVTPASVLANWQELETPTDTVLSVNGQVGTVSLSAANVGALAVANNLSDLSSFSAARSSLGVYSSGETNSLLTGKANSGANADITSLAAADSMTAPPVSGTNVAGLPLNLVGGTGTGQGASGDIVFKSWNTAPSGSTPQTSSSIKVVIKGTGNVGIGNSSPTARLHVSGGGIVATSAGSATEPGAGHIFANNSIQSPLFQSQPVAGSNVGGTTLQIRGGQGTGVGTAADITVSTATPTTSGSTVQGYTNRFTIKGSTGYIGIGDNPTTPKSRLHLIGGGFTISKDATSGGAATDAGAGNMFVEGNGYVGGSLTLGTNPIASSNSTDVATTAFVKTQNYQAALGFTPIQQGGGAGQLTNKIYIGWDGNDARLQVDVTDLGGIALVNKTRVKLQADKLYYVSLTGSDSNNGLTSSTAFRNLQKAIDATSTLDLSIYNVYIQILDGTYDFTNSIILKSYVGAGKVVIQGNAANNSSVNLRITASPTNAFEPALIFGSNVTGTYQFANFKIESTLALGSVIFGIDITNNTIAEVNNINFGANFHQVMRVLNGSKLTTINSYTVSGNSAFGVIVLFNGVFNSRATTINIPSSITGSDWLNASFNSVVLTDSTNVHNGAANFTGRKYALATGTFIFGGASFYPGTVAGSADQYSNAGS